jgi:hypothetical protein
MRRGFVYFPQNTRMEAPRDGEVVIRLESEDVYRTHGAADVGFYVELAKNDH